MMDTDWIQKLKVAELKDELKKRGQPMTGKKAELAERLKAYIQEHEGGAPEEKEEVATVNQEVEAGSEADGGPAAATHGPEEPAAPAEAAEAPASEAEPMEEGPAPEVVAQAKAAPLAAPPAAAKPPSQQRGQQQRGHGQKKGPRGGGRPAGALTLAEIAADDLTRLAEQTWSPAALSSGSAPAFDPDVVEHIYQTELGGGADATAAPSSRRVALLELSGYLENYLWPNFDAEAASKAHVMSIAILVNEKLREGLPGWAWIEKDTADAKFPAFFSRILSLCPSINEGMDDGEKCEALGPRERVAHLAFVGNAFKSLENEVVRSQALRLLSLPLWHALSRGRLQLELHAQPQLGKKWKALAKREAKALAAAGAAHVLAPRRPETAFLSSLVSDFLATLASAVGDAGAAPPRLTLLYLERFVEFLTDLLSQLPTRRFVHALLEDKAVLVKCCMSRLFSHPSGSLFAELVDLFRFYLSFPIDDHTGDALSEDDVTAAHYERVQQLQRLLFKHVPKLRELALANCGAVQRRDTLAKELAVLDASELRFLVTSQLRLVDEDDPWADDPRFLTEVMLAAYERRRGQREIINNMPLYPTEAVLLDDRQVPSAGEGGGALPSDTVLALPKLNLQFLTLPDYLLRNFHLFRLEATYEVRADVADCLSRVQPYEGDDGSPHFGGWARMAQPIERFAVVEVRKPKVGESRPAAVTAEVVVQTRHMRPDVAAEWNDLKQHDVVFLLAVRPTQGRPGGPYGGPLAAARAAGGVEAMRTAGLTYVRGCEVIEIRDEEGKLMNDFTGRVRPDERTSPKGTLRTVTVALDTSQYQMDADRLAKEPGSEDVYSSFNVLMRRKPKENNFKAVLESIRDLMNEDAAVPAWLHDILLGYGDPGAAQYEHMEGQLRTVDFKDTFLDAKHLRESFPGHEVEFVGAKGNEELAKPFRITFEPPAAKAEDGGAKGKRKAESNTNDNTPTTPPRLLVESYTQPWPGPYPQDIPPQNSVRFTPTQVSAIVSGVQPGLTMVVGPPGTGKTDTAVQIMHVLYHNCPGQRTLVITHSNQALNDLFKKIIERDVPARYLLRLGMGEAELDTEEEFSRVGRVNAMLARRLELLAEVQRMARILGVPENVSYTCETAGHFWLLHVLSRWEKFLAEVSARKDDVSAVASVFPFSAFFADAPGPLFLGESFEQDMERARGCFRHLKTLFTELEEVRPFEILKTQADRVNYLLTKQAKIVAMTCTHAALKRHEFLNLAFKYDNLLMEEAAQVLEVETAIPMLLQRPEDGRNRLKRVVMIGDHHQLPPVVKNVALQRYSKLDQSLFARFVRLGTPYIELDAQGRARPALAALYNWRYRGLGDLPAVKERAEFKLGNAGFRREYQLVDVPDFRGRGESEPVAYFYQNLGEAEYLVSVYQYMRLLGYPASRISILTTYNGQRALLRDVVERRCAGHPLFGRPATITTVDKYQGQQNDFVLLSLVKTKNFGHLRDVRRLVVALSRSRLGIYIFGRAGLFANCQELRPAFGQLTARPTRLELLPHERYGAVERAAEDMGPDEAAVQVEGVEHMASIVAHMADQWALAQQAQQTAWQVVEELPPEANALAGEDSDEEEAAVARALVAAEAVKAEGGGVDGERAEAMQE